MIHTVSKMDLICSMKVIFHIWRICFSCTYFTLCIMITLVKDPNAMFSYFSILYELPVAERCQVNRIAPLGFYYMKFNEFVDRYEMNWGACGASQAKTARLLFKS